MQKRYAAGLHAAIPGMVLMSVLTGFESLLTKISALEDRGGGAVRLTISRGAAEARNLFTSCLDFTKYTLSFTPLEGQPGQEDLPWQGESSQEIYLPLGNWTIRATAYITVNGTERPAAYGETDVAVGSAYSYADIEIDAPVEGETGTFEYSINAPPGAAVSGTLEEMNNPGVPHTIAAAGSGTISNAASGIYLLKLEASFNGKTVKRTEIAYIYGNSVTLADYVFTKADFGEPLALSGSIRLTDDGASGSESYSIAVYTDENYTNPIGYIPILLTDTAWSLALPSVQRAKRLYFRVNANGWCSAQAGDIAVPPEDTTNIDLGTVAFINLSGTVKVPAEPALGNLSVTAYTGKYTHWLQDGSVQASGEWAMKILAPQNRTEVSFILRVGSIDFYETAVSRSVYNQAAGSINLTLEKTKTGDTWIDKILVKAGDYGRFGSALFIPDEKGVLVPEVRESSGSLIYLKLYDVLTGNLAANNAGSGAARIEYTLEAGLVYAVTVGVYTGNPDVESYRVRAAFSAGR